jgi:hypothetical protein
MTPKQYTYISLTVFFALLSLPASRLDAQNFNDWENSDVNGINKEARLHATDQE